MHGIGNEQRSLIVLNLLPEIGPVLLRNLLYYFEKVDGVLAASVSDLCAVEGMTRALASRIVEARDNGAADREIDLAEKTGVVIVTMVDPGYPEGLKNLSAAPPVLYVHGGLEPQDNFSVAIVGTRRPTPYGRNVASRFAQEFAREGVTTVSGLARGIDTEVHTTTLAHRGRTIAVLGNGLNQHYPPENRKLEEKITRQGALLSEFPLNAHPDKTHFPRRNRIISGLSLATLVVEADTKSGALITARYAAEQGKDVFAVPGPIFSRVSAGPHRLLRSGAMVAESASDVIEAIEPLAAWLSKKRRAAPAPRQEEIAFLDAAEEAIVRLLDPHINGVSIDYLADQIRCSPGSLAERLLYLELKGYIQSLPGKMYILKRGIKQCQNI